VDTRRDRRDSFARRLDQPHEGSLHDGRPRLSAEVRAERDRRELSDDIHSRIEAWAAVDPSMRAIVADFGHPALLADATARAAV
jgi:hypothetical protein